MLAYKQFIRSICDRYNRVFSRISAKERGQALPITLAALALGIIVVSPFLTHASTTLIGSQNYGQIIKENYSADSGIEHAVWRLAYENLPDQIPDMGDHVSYTLPAMVNAIEPNIVVTRISSDTFQIMSRANSFTITATVRIIGESATLLSWVINR